MDGITEWLQSCDERRYANPKGTLCELDARVAEVPEELIPLWCGVTGSCLRLLFRYDEAHDVLREGLNAADDALDHAAAGDIHQRIFAVWWVTPNYKKALQETAKAAMRYTEAQSESGIARTLVDRGNALTAFERWKWADACYRLALEQLPESESRYKAAAFQGLGMSFLAQGKAEEALQMIGLAEGVPLDPINAAQVKWLNGRALAELERFAAALAKLEECSATLLELAPNNGALCALDLAATYLLAGDTSNSHRVARQLSQILPFIERKSAHIAAAELVNIGLAGEGLTLSFLQDVKKRVRCFYE